MAITVLQKHGSFNIIMLDVNVNICGNVISQQLFFMIIITISSKNVTFLHVCWQRKMENHQFIQGSFLTIINQFPYIVYVMCILPFLIKVPE
jgi:hypothetical protein